VPSFDGCSSIFWQEMIAQQKIKNKQLSSVDVFMLDFFGTLKVRIFFIAVKFFLKKMWVYGKERSQ